MPTVRISKVERDANQKIRIHVGKVRYIVRGIDEINEISVRNKRGDEDIKAVCGYLKTLTSDSMLTVRNYDVIYV